MTRDCKLPGRWIRTVTRTMIARTKVARTAAAGLGVACLLTVGCARDNGALQTAFHRFWGFTPGEVATAVREAPRSAADSVGKLVDRVRPGSEAWAADPFLAADLDGSGSPDAASAGTTTTESETQLAALEQGAAEGTLFGATDAGRDGEVMLVQNPPIVGEISSADAANPFAELADQPRTETTQNGEAAASTAASTAAPNGESPFEGSQGPSVSPLVQLKDALNNGGQSADGSNSKSPRISPEAAREEIDRLMLACRQEMRRGEYAIALRVALAAEQLADSAAVFFGPDEEQPGDVVVQLRDRLALAATASQSEVPAEVPTQVPTGIDAIASTDAAEAAADAAATAAPEAAAEETVTIAPQVASGPDTPAVLNVEPPPGWSDEPSATPPSTTVASATETSAGLESDLEAGLEPTADPFASSDPSSDRPSAPREFPIHSPDPVVSNEPGTNPSTLSAAPSAAPDVAAADVLEIVEPSRDRFSSSSLGSGVVSGPDAVVVMPTPPESRTESRTPEAPDARLAARDGFSQIGTDTPPALFSRPEATAATETTAATSADQLPVTSQPVPQPILEPTPQPARVTANQAATLGPVVPEPFPPQSVTVEPTGPSLASASSLPRRYERQKAFAAVTLASPVTPPPVAPSPLPDDTLTQRPYDVLYGSEEAAAMSDAPLPPPVPDLSWEDEVETVKADESGPASWLIASIIGAATVLTTVFVLRRR